MNLIKINMRNGRRLAVNVDNVLFIEYNQEAKKGIIYFSDKFNIEFNTTQEEFEKMINNL